MAFAFTHTRDVRSVPEAVFDTLMQPAHRKSWCYGVREIKRLDDGPLAVGGRWLETGRNREAGLDETNEFTCTIAERARHVRFIMSGPPKGPEGGSFHWDYRLEPLDGGTRIVFEFASHTKGILGMLIGIGKKAFEMQSKGEIDDLVEFLATRNRPA